MYAKNTILFAVAATLASLATALPNSNSQDFLNHKANAYLDKIHEGLPGQMGSRTPTNHGEFARRGYNGTVVTTTRVVEVLTTYCPEPTTLEINGKKYVVEEPTTLTIADCPCTVVEPCFTCAPPAPTSYVAPPQPAPPAITPAPGGGIPGQPGEVPIVKVNGAAEKGVSFAALAGVLAMLAI